MSARRSEITALVLFSALALVGFVRAMTAHAVTPWWDLDPVFAEPAETAMLVSAQFALDGFVWLIGGGCAVWGGLSGVRIRWGLGAMVVFGALGVWIHGVHKAPFVANTGQLGDFRSLLIGSGWASALIGAWSMAHLVRAESVRRVVVGVLGGFAFMLVARGALQVYVEHAFTVRQFETDPAAYLARSGIEPGSSMARVFERRLMNSQAGGWFGLSNVYASAAAGCAVILFGALVGAWRELKQAARWLIGLGLVGALFAVYLSKSKGGYAAVGIGWAVVVAARLFGGKLRGRWWGAAGVLCIFGVMVLVGVRGLVGERIDELSLLFRWHYLVGAARIAEAFPMMGCGPARFQDAYLLYKVPLNPEEVARAHNVVADWVSTLGVFGWVWVAVLVRLAWDAGRAVACGLGTNENGPSPGSAEQNHPLPGKGEGGEERIGGGPVDGSKYVLAVVGLATAASIWMEQAALEAVGALTRLGACAVWVGAGVVLARHASVVRWAGLALGAGALALLAHGQIEVSMTHSGAALWIMLVVGAAAGIGDRRAEAAGERGAMLAVGAALVVGGVGTLWMGAVRARDWEGHLHAAMLEAREVVVEDGIRLDRLAAASRMLVEASGSLGGEVVTLDEAARLVLLGNSVEIRFDEDRAGDPLDALLEGWTDRAKTWSMMASAYELRTLEGGEGVLAGERWQGRWRQVEMMVRQAATFDPYSVAIHYRGMIAARNGGDMERARGYARELLELNEHYRLDPLKQLSEAQLSEVRRVAAGAE